MRQASLQIYQGDDYAAAVTVSNTDGTPADLTGYTAQAQIRRGAADAAPVELEFTATIQSPKVLLALTHSQTAIMSGAYVWDLQLAGESGAVTTIMAGQLRVTQEVTRAESGARRAKVTA